MNAQLIATETGAHLWADRFDQKLNDLSAGQEEIVRRIGQTLNVALTDIETARSKRERPTNPDSFDLILRARSLVLHPMGPDEHAERRALLERALLLDPNSIIAKTQLADELYSNGEGEHERAAKLIADATAINPNNPYVLEATAHLLLSEGHTPKQSRPISASWTNIRIHITHIPRLGCVCCIQAGPISSPDVRDSDPTRSTKRMELRTIRKARLCAANAPQRRRGDSRTQRALATTPNGYTEMRAQLNLRLAAAHARLGHFDAAHRALAEANRIWPYDTVRNHWPEDPSSHVYVEQIEQFQAALRLAGHRDHSEEYADFGAPSDGNLHYLYAGLTPTTVPGATTTHTSELEQLLRERKPIVIDPLCFRGAIDSWRGWIEKRRKRRQHLRRHPGAIAQEDAGVD